MKILRAGYRDLNDENARRIFVEVTPGATSPESSESGNELLNDALRSPLRFGVRQMRLLEQHIDELTDKQKAKFQDFAAYYLTQASNAGLSQIPPRVLTRLETSPLKTLLSQRMREQLTRVLDERTQQLEQMLAKSPDQWNPHQASTVCSLYRRLRKSAVGEAGDKKSLFEVARDKLIEYAIGLLRQGSVSEKIRETIENASERNARTRPLNAQEKLLIAGVFRMFPQESDWVDHCDSQQARKFTKEAVAALKKNPGNPTFLTGWELLEDLSQDETEVAAEIENEIGADELQKLLGRSRATQFLKWATTQRGYLKSHLSVLRQIQTDPDFLPDGFGLSQWRETLPEAKKIRDLEEKQRKTKEEYDQKKDAEFDRYRTSHPDAQSVQKIYETRTKRDKTYDEFWTDQVGKIDDLIEQWDHIRAFSVKAAERRAQTLAGKLSMEAAKDATLKEKYEREQEEYVQHYVAQLEGALEKFREAKTRSESIVPPADTDDEKAVEAYRRKQRDFIDDFDNLVAKKLPFREEVEQEVPFLKNLGEATKVFFDVNKKLEEDEKAAIETMPFSEDFHAEKTRLEEELKNMKTKQDGLVREQGLQMEWGKVFADPRAAAEAAEKDFWNDLKNRIENHQLHAADFEILWNDDFADEVREHLGAVPEWDKIAAFREKFSAVVPEIFDGISFGDDAVQTASQQADERLSYKNLQHRLVEQGVDLKALFPKQKMDELLEGAVHGTRDHIFAELRRTAGSRADDIWTGMERVHGRLDTAVPDPTQVHAEHVRHETMQQETGTKLQKAKEINEAYVEKLLRRAEEETDPEKRAIFLREAEKLKELFEAQSGWYQGGGKMKLTFPDGSVSEVWAPGKSLLNELDLQGRRVSQEVAHITGRLRDELSTVQTGFQNLGDATPAERDVRVPDILARLDGAIGSWPTARGKLTQRINDLRVVMENVLPDEPLAHEFIESYLGSATKWIEALDKKMEVLRAEAHKNGKNFTGHEHIWQTGARMLQQLEKSLDFRDGAMAEDSAAVDGYLEQDGKTLEFLNANGFWDDDTPEKRAKFRARFNEIAAEYRSTFSEYERSYSKVKSRLQGDIDRLSEDEFVGKYNLDSAYMQELLDAHGAQVTAFAEMSDSFLAPDFFSGWLDRYNESPEQRLLAIEEMSKFQDLQTATEGAKENTENMGNWILEWDDNKKKNPVKTYTKFSIYDIYATIKQTIDVVQRRWERRSERSVAAMGMYFYGETSNWGKEFKQKSEAAEEARVKEYEEQYGEQPGWDIMQALYRSNDADEAKACIRLALDKGFLKWDDPSLWRTLMRLSNNAVIFRIPEDLKLNPKDIFDKVRDACEFIWSKETFRQWDTAFDGKLKSAREGYDREFASYENDPDARVRTLANMLQRWKRGDTTNVDPAKYEHFISAAFRDGKMNGTPDSRWYFMVLGATLINPATGSAILSRDVFMRFNKDFLARFPHVEFFTDKDSPKLNGRIVPERTPGAKVRAWTFEDYQAWGEFLGEGEGSFDPRSKTSPTAAKRTEEFFYHYVHMSPYARDRVQRMERMSDKEGDHDDAKSFFAEWTSRQVISHLTNASDAKVKHSGDFWRTYLAGFDPYMKNMYSYIQKGDVEWGEAPYWRKERDRVLQEVGDRLRVALITTQTLQGNMHETKQQSPVTLDDEEWRKSTGYSISADVSRQQVNKMTRNILAAGGGDVQKYLENLEEKSALKYGNNWEKRSKTADMPQRIAAMSELVNAKGMTQYFGNLDAVEQALKNYCAAGGAMAA